MEGMDLDDHSRNVVSQQGGASADRRQPHAPGAQRDSGPPRISRSALDPVLRPLAEAALHTCAGALARVWLVGPGDLCPTCAQAPNCPRRERCLHLVASAGLTQRLDGPFRRFPFGHGEVGHVPLTRRPYVVNEGLADLGLAEAAWLANHRIAAFGAWPLEYGGDVIGVLAVFACEPLDERRRTAIARLGQVGALALGHLRAFRELATERNRTVARTARRASAPDRDPARELRPLAETERETIERVLAHTRGKVSGPNGAARILGLKPTTLFSRMLKLGVRRPGRGGTGT